MSAVDWLDEVGENDVPSVHQMGAMREIRDRCAQDSWVEGPLRVEWAIFFCFGILFGVKRHVETFLMDTFGFVGHYDFEGRCDLD